ncbi:SAF domain-containing protein, partial [Enterococcus asini]|uniref:SAF domain-containing protein n=1 Tax=Enterococcus asini TaxID=57732 RepID=UPI0026DB452F
MANPTITKKADLLKLNPRDNVAVALHPIAKGTELHIDDLVIVPNQDIPQGHKIALESLPENADVIKYGYPIGHVTTDVAAGDWIHTQNVKTNLSGELDYTYEPNLHEIKYPKQDLTFQGYRRANGKVGIRNDLLIVPTVGCINGMAEIIVQQ